MLNQIPTWAWAIVPAAAFAFLWRQRVEVLPPRAAASPEPFARLQEEMLRGLLRKEGLLAPEPPAGEPSVFACPQRFKVVPVEK